MNSKWILLPLATVVALSMSCSSKPAASPPPAVEVDRVPASADDEVEAMARFETSYQEVMASEKPEEEFVSMIDRMAAIYFRAAGAIHKFDEDLAADATPSNDEGLPHYMMGEAYSKVQASYVLQERLHHKIIYMYQRLNEDRDAALEAAKDSNQISADAQKYSRIRKEVLHHLQAMAKNENIFAADQLINDMHEFHASHIAELQAGQKSAEGIPRELSSLHAQVVSFGSKTRSFFHRYEARLRKRMDDQMTSDDEQELERESGNFRDDFASADRMMRDRLPAAQSAGGKKLYPSPDPAGNIFGGNSDPGSWTLTFDDGPHPIYTMQIMHNMDALGFRPTFFWLGMNLQSERLKAIAAYAKSKSYVLGNHSMTHINFQGVRAANMSKAIQDEVIHPSQIDDSVYTYHPQFYRCPYGACLHVPPVRQAIANLHDIHVFWSVDSLDWNRAANPNGPSDIVNRVRAQMQKATHGVVLFHDIHPQSVLASNEIAKFLKANASKGFRHIDLCQVVDEANGDPQGTYCHGHADP